jgi:hypothetical protein
MCKKDVRPERGQYQHERTAGGEGAENTTTPR